VELRRGICFARFLSQTKNSKEVALLEAEDTVMLANGCSDDVLKTAVANSLTNPSTVNVENENEMLARWTLRMRFSWLEEKWRNNIHTNSYARSLGYTGPLVEGPAVVDRVLWIHEALNGPLRHFRVEWKYCGPLYDQLPVTVFPEGEGAEGTFRYSLCSLQESLPGIGHVLMKIVVAIL